MATKTNGQHSMVQERLQNLLHGGSGSLTGLGIIILGSLALPFIMFATDGNLFAGGAFLALLAIVLVTYYRLDWGFYLFLGMVLVFDQFSIPRFEPFTVRVGYFRNLKETYLPGIDAAVLNPVELHLFLLLFVWVLVLATRKNVKYNRVPVWFTAILFFLWLAFSFAYGLMRNGDFLPALWELRALAYLAILYFFVPQIIQTRKQITVLIWIVIGTIVFKALQGGARFIRLGFSSQGAPSLTNHEDPIFIVTLFVMLFGFILYKVDSRQRKLLMLFVLPLLLGFFVAQRRSAYGSFAVSIIAFIVMVPGKERWKLLRVIFPGIVLFAIYLAVFWNSNSSIAYTAQLMKSAFSKEEDVTGDRYYSNLYREYEKYNLAKTIQQSPVLGIGFGKKYDQPLELWSIPFTLKDYIPHNEILWVMVKMGAVGFFLFFLFLNTFVFQGASIYTNLQDPYYKAICGMCVIAVLGQIVASYFDLQLTYYRNMIYLGMLMGLLPVLESLDRQTAPYTMAPQPLYQSAA